MRALAVVTVVAFTAGAVTLIAAPARAEIVTLLCDSGGQVNGRPWQSPMEVDLAARTVRVTYGHGPQYVYTAPAEINDRYIKWDFSGRTNILDRITGEWSDPASHASTICKRVQKVF